MAVAAAAIRGFACGAVPSASVSRRPFPKPRRQSISIERAIAGGQGPRIAPEVQRRIFDKFCRVATGHIRRAGTCLGLAIARGMVEVHGGRIRADPTDPDGSGTLIVLRLPLSNPEL